MATYTIKWGNFTNTAFYGELPVTTFTYSDVLNSPGSITGTIPLNPYPGVAGDVFTIDLFQEGNTLLWVARDGVPVWVGVLWGWDIDSDNDQLTFTGEGWHSYLRRRLTGATEFVATDQVDLVNTLVTFAANTAFLTGYTFTGPTTTGVTRDVAYLWWDFTTIAEAVEQLAAMEDGFDFRWRPSVNSLGVWGVDFEFQYPAGGTDTGLVFDLDSNIASLRMSSDGKSLGTNLVGTGNGTGAETIVASNVSNELLDGGWPQLDLVTTYPDVNDTALLQALVDRDARRLRTTNRQLDLEVYADTLPKVTDYQVGDIIRVTAQRGVLQLVAAPYRVTEKTVAVDEGGNEQVNLSVAPAEMF